MKKYKLTRLGRITLIFLIVLLIIISSVLLTYNYCKKKYQKELNIEIKKISYQKELHNLSKTEVKKISDKSSDNNIDEIKLQVFFEADSVLLDEQYFSSLNLFIDRIKNLNNIVVSLAGNCATTHNNLYASEIEYNYNIGLERANSVAYYLESKGIRRDEISIISNGSFKPIKDNNSDEGRKFNRYCELTIRYK